MASANLDASIHNTSDVGGFRAGSAYLRPDNFLYYDTDNSAYLHFVPSKDGTMTPGTLAPLPESSALNPSDTIFYLLGLGEILNPQQIAGLRFDGAWQSHCYQDATHGQYWAFTPKAEIALVAAVPCRVDIDGIVTGREGALKPTATLKVSYWKVGSITGTGTSAMKEASIKVEMRRRPEEAPLANVNDKFVCRCIYGHEENYLDFQGIEVINLTRPDHQVVRNSFTLDIENKPGVDTIHADDNTKLLISFAAAETPFGALASPEDLSGILVTRGAGAEDWTITPRMDVETPYWTVTIKAGRPISGQLLFTEVVSRLEPGLADITVQFDGVPGCQPGHVIVPLFKYTPPYLIEAKGDAWHRPIGGSQLNLSWTAVSINPIRIAQNNPSGYIYGSDFEEVGTIIRDYPESSESVASFSALGVFQQQDTYIEFGSVPIEFEA
jgi:hypothetical protein